MRQENLEEMAQLLACIGFLLYILYKSTAQNLDDLVKVPPLRSDQHISLSPKPDRSPKPIITTGSDFTEYQRNEKKERRERGSGRGKRREFCFLFLFFD